MDASSSLAAWTGPVPRLPRLEKDIAPPQIVGLGSLFKLISAGTSLRNAFRAVSEQARLHPEHVGVQIDLATMNFMMGDAWTGNAIAIRRQALARHRVYRVAGDLGAPLAPRLRLLAFVSEEAPRSTLPVDLLLQGSDVQLDLLYVHPGQTLPEAVPDHDVAMVAAGEGDLNRETLQWLALVTDRWPRPVVNDPALIAALSRDRLAVLLVGIEGIIVPPTARVTWAAAARLGAGTVPLESLLPGGRFPLLIRPTASHAGKNLEKIDAPAALPNYLARGDAAEFYLSPFTDYLSSDGLYRKYRLAFVGGCPFLCHLAISEHWMIHYVTAGMAESAAKRAEEERAIRDFERGFARRHEAALRSLADRVGLDYFGLDCAETPDGRLLVFEVETAMMIHALDSADLFPYKREPMRRVFDAFTTLLGEVAAREASST